MAEDKKRKFPQFTSPIGTFKWPKLTEPDYGNKDYPKPQGVYGVSLVLKADAKETKAFLAALQAPYKEALSEAAEAFSKLKVETRKKLKKVTENALYTELFDKETEEPTGEIEFKVSMTASGEYKKGPKAGKKWEAKPTLFDAKGKRMVSIPSIWGGTTGRVAFAAQPYFIPGTGAAGLKLRLLSAQIIDLVSEGHRTAEQYGFGEEEGYSHEDAPSEAASDATETAGGADDGSGDF